MTPYNGEGSADEPVARAWANEKCHPTAWELRMPVAPDERAASIQRIRATLQRLADSPLEDFTRPDLGQVSFERFRPAIDQVNEAARILLGSHIESLPPSFLNDIEVAFSQVDGRLRAFKEFDVLQISARNENVNQTWQRTMNDFDATELDFWKRLGPVVGYLAGKKLVLDPEGQALVAQSRNAQAAIGTAQNALSQLEGLLGTAREALAKEGASRHADLFGAESRSSEKSSKRWLIVTTLFAAITAGCALWNVVYSAKHPAAAGAPFNLQLAIAKVIGLSVLLSATIWCGRVYRSLKHNSIVNKHRQNSLNSFETFVSAAGDEQTKNAVLLHAAQSIFAPQSSGFSSTDTEPTTGGTQMVELIRTMSPTQRGT